jgi:hypothetical protein
MFALERSRDLGSRGRDEGVHGPPELGPPARREPDRVRPVGRREVEDVDPVVGRRTLSGDALEVIADRRHPAGAGRSGHEQVVAVRRHLEAELDRVERARLADRPGKRLDLGRGLEWQARGIEAAPEGARRKLEAAFGFGHVHHPVSYAGNPHPGSVAIPISGRRPGRTLVAMTSSTPRARSARP